MERGNRTAFHGVSCAVIATLLQACAGLEAAPTGPSPAGIPRLDHVVVIVMENKSDDQVRDQPFIRSLIRGGSSSSNSYALTHPSQPNYLALWSGGFQGVTGDRCPATAAPLTSPNLGQACEAAGLTWRAYSEDLPAAGSSACASTRGSYVRRHAPWTNFGNLNHSNERPYTDLAADIASGSLPGLAFVIPNLCHDMHDCSVSQGDSWLSDNLPPILEGLGAGGLVVITWDEDDGNAGNHILTIFAGPPVRAGYVSPRFINHYTLLRTISETLGLAAFGNATQDSSITDVWAGEPFNPPGEESSRVRLSLAYPLPSPAAVFSRLHLPIELRVTAGVFDAAGRQVRALVDGPLSGDVELRWDGWSDAGGPAAGGVYFLRVYAGDVLFQRRIVRVK